MAQHEAAGRAARAPLQVATSDDDEAVGWDSGAEYTPSGAAAGSCAAGCAGAGGGGTGGANCGSTGGGTSAAAGAGRNMWWVN